MSTPSGLDNLGNTCYMNSAIQALWSLPNNIWNDVNMKEDTIGEQWTLLSGYMNTKNLLRKFVEKYKHFSPPQQQDVQEFLIILIDEMIESSKIEMEKSSSKLSRDVFWNKFFKKSYSPVVDKFYGQYQILTRCTNCKYKNTTFEPFLSYNLDVSNKDKHLVGLDDSSRYSAHEEHVPDWECESCKQKTIVRQQLICRFPQYLMVTWKRFSETGKNNHPMSFLSTWTPSSNICVDDVNPPKYKLTSVIYHIGNSIGTGRYITCCCRNRKWWIFDDNSVNEIRELTTQDAYIMIYTRINPK